MGIILGTHIPIPLYFCFYTVVVILYKTTVCMVCALCCATVVLIVGLCDLYMAYFAFCFCHYFSFLVCGFTFRLLFLWLPLRICGLPNHKAKVRDLEEKCRSQSEQFNLLSKELERFRLQTGKFDILSTEPVTVCESPGSPNKTLSQLLNGLAAPIRKGLFLWLFFTVHFKIVSR